MRLEIVREHPVKGKAMTPLCLHLKYYEQELEEQMVVRRNYTLYIFYIKYIIIFIYNIYL